MGNIANKRLQQTKHAAHGIMAGVLLGSLVAMGTKLLLFMRWVGDARCGIGRKSLELQGQMVETVGDALTRVRGMASRTTA